MYLELALYVMSLPIAMQICINSIVFIALIVLFIINDKLEKRSTCFYATLTASSIIKNMALILMKISFKAFCYCVDVILLFNVKIAKFDKIRLNQKHLDK